MSAPVHESAFTRPSSRPSSRRAAAPGLRVAWAGPLGWVVCVAALLLYAIGVAAGWASVLGAGVATAAVVLSVPWFARIARRWPGLEIAGILRLSLGVKLIATLARFAGREDSVDYHRAGSLLADSFRRLDFVVDPGREVPGTGTVRYLTGLVEVATFENEFATFAVFSLFGFVGLVWFVEAFRIALPGVDHRRYALLLLFWPSLVYWPSSIGKESLMLLGLGGVALGLAKLLRGRVAGLFALVPGLALCGFIRPHVALIVVAAAISAFVMRAPGHGATSKVVRLSVIAGLVVGGAVASDAVEALLNIDGLHPSGLSAALDLVNTRSSQGGSSFSAARIDGILEYPWGFVTVLFRPFPYEAGSPSMLLTSFEALVLAVLVLAAVPRLLAATRSIREEAYVVYAVGFTAVFVYLFSALGNFGILARQRSMTLPLLLVLIALPTARQRVRHRRVREAADPESAT